MTSERGGRGREGVEGSVVCMKVVKTGGGTVDKACEVLVEEGEEEVTTRRTKEGEGEGKGVGRGWRGKGSGVEGEGEGRGRGAGTPAGEDSQEEEVVVTVEGGFVGQ